MTSEIPEHGVQIECTLEDEPRFGHKAWINIEEVKDEEHVQFLIDSLTGRNLDPYPDSWNEEGTFKVIARNGLGVLAEHEDGNFVGSIDALISVVDALDRSELPVFVEWAQSSGHWWQPGITSDLWPIDDVISCFRDAVLINSCPPCDP